LNNASITTLHSFCLEIVRENFFMLDIDPNFRIVNDTEGELLRFDAVEEVLEEHYINSKEDDLFLKLIDAYGGEKDDSIVKELILNLYEFSGSNPWPEKWLDESSENLSHLDWFSYLLPLVKVEFKECENLLIKALSLANSSKGPLAYTKVLNEDLACIEDLIGACNKSWDLIYNSLEEQQFARLPSIKKNDDVDPDLKELVQGLRDEVKKKISKIENKYFMHNSEVLEADLLVVKPMMKVLIQLVKDFKTAYWNKKQKRNVLDFTDLEHFCLQILLEKDSSFQNLNASKVCLRLKENYEEILVDEYQDINDVQETILHLVSKNNNRFMVGDVKQSIYRFRLANPELFIEKYRNYEKSPQDIRIDLSKNFRCREEIVDGVNFIFSQIMNTEFGKIDYDDKAKLILGASYPDIAEESSIKGAIEVHILDKKTDDEQNYLQREASLVGRKIKELLKKESKIFDKNIGEYRNLTYRDIVILFRSPRGNAEFFLEEFRSLDIPVYAELGSGYFDATEIKVMLSLLKIIDNPYQDIPLASVLRSPLIGLNTEELSIIALNNKEKNFFEAVKQTAVQNQDELSQKLNDFLLNLDKWRTLARHGNLADLVWDLFLDTGYYEYVGGMPGGNQRQANLRVLHERARQYEETSFRGLFMFLRFIERLRENKGDMERARALGENENVVRIMSIHKSKGLEFPLVFVVGLGKNFNLTDLNKDIILDKDMGLGPMYIDIDKRIKYPTIAKLVIENKLKIETLAEELRILYVALTRAREKLVLVGSISNIDKKADEWSQLIDNEQVRLTFYNLVNSKNYLDWIGPCLARHTDGENIRNLSALSINSILKDNSKWEVTLYQSENEIEKDEIKKTNEDLLEKINYLKPIEVESAKVIEVSKRLDWQYLFQSSLGKEAKLSVTEIKDKFKKPVSENKKDKKEETKIYTNFNRRPNFMQKEKGLTALEKGSAIHLVMQHIELNQEITKDYLNNLVNFLINQEILTNEQSRAVDLDLIINFFKSKLGLRMKQSKNVKRELPFSLTLPANMYYEDVENEKILVQGIIDCLWQEEKGFILLDYKSDYVTRDNIPELVNRYEGQINLYTKAIEKIYKEPVVEKYIYLFNLQEAIKM
ncbi:DNA helicase/exodeoxyribonuclease V, subunit A, partial [Desulfonispora thiosulfatigenes DSM 11270]